MIAENKPGDRIPADEWERSLNNLSYNMLKLESPSETEGKIGKLFDQRLKEYEQNKNDPIKAPLYFKKLQVATALNNEFYGNLYECVKTSLTNVHEALRKVEAIYRETLRSQNNKTISFFHHARIIEDVLKEIDRECVMIKNFLPLFPEELLEQVDTSCNFLEKRKEIAKKTFSEKLKKQKKDKKIISELQNNYTELNSEALITRSFQSSQKALRAATALYTISESKRDFVKVGEASELFIDAYFAKRREKLAPPPPLPSIPEPTPKKTKKRDLHSCHSIDTNQEIPEDRENSERKSQKTVSSGPPPLSSFSSEEEKPETIRFDAFFEEEYGELSSVCSPETLERSPEIAEKNFLGAQKRLYDTIAKICAYENQK